MTNEDIREGIWSGLIAGAVFIVVEMAMIALFMGESGWAPVKMIAGIVMGRNAVFPLHFFDIGVVVSGFLIHFVLAAVYAVILVTIIRRQSKGGAAISGMLFGLALYTINFYGFTEIFPWFEEARNWVTVFAHLLYGFSAGYVYKAYQERYQCETC